MGTHFQSRNVCYNTDYEMAKGMKRGIKRKEIFMIEKSGTCHVRLYMLRLKLKVFVTK